MGSTGSPGEIVVRACKRAPEGILAFLGRRRNEFVDDVPHRVPAGVPQLLQLHQGPHQPVVGLVEALRVVAVELQLGVNQTALDGVAAHTHPFRRRRRARSACSWLTYAGGRPGVLAA